MMLINQQPIRACNPIINVTSTCSFTTTDQTVTINALIHLTNFHVYCSPSDISTSLASVSTRFNPLVVAQFPNLTVNMANYTTEAIKFNGVSSFLTGANRQYETYPNCNYINGAFSPTVCKDSPTANPEVSPIAQANGRTNLKINAAMLTVTFQLATGRKMITCQSGEVDIYNTEQSLINRMSASAFKVCNITRIIPKTDCQIVTATNVDRVITYNVEFYLNSTNQSCTPVQIRTAVLAVSAAFQATVPGLDANGVANANIGTTALPAVNAPIFVSGSTTDAAGVTTNYRNCIYINAPTPANAPC